MNHLDMQKTIDATLQHLQQGETILYPTDTIWGIGCDATCSPAIEQLYAIKQRDHHKSMLILCANEAMVLRYVPSATEAMLRLCTESDRPTTVIFPQAQGLPANLLASDGSIGIRIPKHEFCHQLLLLLDHPIVSTSANLSGHPSPATYADIEPTLFKHIGYAVPNLPFFTQSTHVGSRILKVEANGIVTTLRQ